MVTLIQSPVRKRGSKLEKKMVQKEYRLRHLECVKRDIFRNWGLTKYWYPTMSKQGGISPGFNFNPSETFYGRVEVPQGQHALHHQGEIDRPSSDTRSEEPSSENRPQNINEDTAFIASSVSPLANLTHTLESRIPLNNHEQSSNRSFRTPSIQRGFAQNILSGIGSPLTRASFLPYNARATYEAWRNRNRGNAMEEFSRNVNAHSTGIEETGDEEEGSESEGVCELSGDMPAQSTAVGQLPEFHQSFGSPIPREDHQNSRNRFRFDQSMPPQSTAIGQLPEFRESFGSPIPRVERSTRGHRASPSSQPEGDDMDHQSSRTRFRFDQSMPAQSTAVGQLPEFRQSFGSPIPRVERPTRGFRTSPSPQSSDFRGYAQSPASNEVSQEQAARDVQRMISFDQYNFETSLPAQSTARGQLPQFHQTFGSPIPKEKPMRVPYQYLRPNVTKMGASGRSGSATPQSDEVCESPSPRSDDILQGSPYRYGADSTMPFQSTAIGQLPGYHPSFGSPIPREMPTRGLRVPTQYLQAHISGSGSGSNWGRSASPRSDEVCESPSPQSCDIRSYSQSPQSGDRRSHTPSPASAEFLQDKSSDRLGGGASPKRSYQTQCGASQNEESFMERFDKAVEKELERYRNEGPTDTSMNVSLSRPLGPSDSRALDSVTSSIEIISRMKGDQDTELTDAVEKLAKAEATVLFQGAIEAAEQAAANAPPEYAEEAAAASARAHTKIYNAELTNVVHESVPGIRPIEIVGYVGVTRPKKPLRP